MPLARFPSFPAPSHCLFFLLLSFSHFCPLYCVCFSFFSIRSTRRLLLCLPLPFEFASVVPPSPPLFFNAESAAIENKKQRKAGTGSGSGGKGGTKNSVWDVYGAFRCTLGTTQHRGHNCPVCRFYWYCHWADIDHYLWLSTRTLLIRSVALKKAWNKHKEKPKLTPDFNCNLYSHLLSKFNRINEGEGG